MSTGGIDTTHSGHHESDSEEDVYPSSRSPRRRRPSRSDRWMAEMSPEPEQILHDQAADQEEAENLHEGSLASLSARTSENRTRRRHPPGVGSFLLPCAHVRHRRLPSPERPRGQPRSLRASPG